MKKLKERKLFEQIVSELECAKIESGIFDVYNPDHLILFVEHMVEFGMSEMAAEQYLEMALEEGKYPDRQAFNKEGWLVTFPSKGYRDAAIKKGTHSISDPTHGKGGMNLYYKRKGKQRRQKTQDTSTVQAPEEAPKAPVYKQKTQPPAVKQKQQATGTDSSQQPKPDEDQEDTDYASRDDDLEKYIANLSGNKFKSKYSKPTDTTATTQNAQADQTGAAPAPAIDVPVITTPAPQYANVSKKFATKKGWKAEPYGEYRDAEGNPVAVVGLSGEVVPIRNNDREEYKIFAEKEMQQS
jgi:hypothetical protein